MLVKNIQPNYYYFFHLWYKVFIGCKNTSKQYLVNDIVNVLITKNKPHEGLYSQK
jgi:hypothetical protein